MVSVQHHVTLGSSIQLLLKFNSMLSAVSWLSVKAVEGDEFVNQHLPHLSFC